MLYYLNGVGNTWLPLADGAAPASRAEALALAEGLDPATAGVRTSAPAPGDALAFFSCDALCGNQSFEAAPVRDELMLFRERFPDARRGGAERVRLVRAGAESATTPAADVEPLENTSCAPVSVVDFSTGRHGSFLAALCRGQAYHARGVSSLFILR